jgi:hypothetical protein
VRQQLLLCDVFVYLCISEDVADEAHVGSHVGLLGRVQVFGQTDTLFIEKEN